VADAAPRRRRLVGVETEFAVHFVPDREGDIRPTHEAVYKALLASLKANARSCEAVYYKGGEFLENGSLVHFEVGRLEDPTTGLLEWASPECLSAKDLVAFLKAEERALVDAIPEAEKQLRSRGHEGKIVALKNNRDRFGNDYGSHESYDAYERPLGAGRRFVRGVLHPIVLAGILVLGIATALPFIALLLALLILVALVELVGLIGPVRPVAEAVRARIGQLATWLVEIGPRRGSGIFPLALLQALRAAAWVFSITARAFMFHGHLGPLLPFLVTRQVFAGSGWVSPDGRYLLSVRSRALRRAVSAYNFGPMRPIVDLKEYFYFRPLSHAVQRKRLHLLPGDSNRCEYAEHLKLATTLAVLDAIEAGALDATAASIRLVGGPLGALRATSEDPTFQAIVAHDRKTGAGLTALDVQRRWLEATWEHFRKAPDVDADTKEALVRWGFVLDQLAQDPLSLDRELDWVLKKRLLDRTLEEALPEDGWAKLATFGAINAALEESSPDIELPASGGDAVRAAVVAALGARAAARLERGLPADVSWSQLPAVREAWLRIKLADLRYHEISVEGGFYDWFAKDGLVARVLEPGAIERALHDPPADTRARIRGEFVRNAASYRACRVGWDRVVIEPRGEPPRTISLEDPYKSVL
jgi:proteasome accessory factor A